MRWVIAGAAFVFVLFAIWFEMQPSTYNETTVVIVDQISESVLGEFVVEVADTRIKQAKGLGGREELEEGRGMIFVYDEPRFQMFWMKDMLISIDLLWVHNGQVVGVERDMLPPAGGVLKNYHSPEPVDVVLEVSAGTVDQLGVEVGDRLFVK